MSRDAGHLTCGNSLRQRENDGGRNKKHSHIIFTLPLVPNSIQDDSFPKGLVNDYSRLLSNIHPFPLVRSVIFFDLFTKRFFLPSLQFPCIYQRVPLTTSCRQMNLHPYYYFDCKV
ncbi:hypothetical protein AFLA_013951 [Aspergillus flavus NRRL3357]|nr:hypothetical protein AFLA_013951 [Aspergillus flavus NRRL3357]